jgi:hypothetical protein
MKVLMFLLAFTLGIPAFAQESNAKQLDGLAREFGEAWLNADFAKLDHMLAHEYQHTDVTGKVFTREDWLSDAVDALRWLRPQDTNGKPSIGFEDMAVTFTGDSAVITGRQIIHSANTVTKPMNIRFTQIWIKEDGTWKRRFFQGTLVYEPRKQSAI